MNKNIVIMFVAAVVLLIVATVIAVSLRNGGEEIAPPLGNYDPYGTPTSGVASSPETIGAVTVYPSVVGWRLVKNNDINISLKVPEDWDISGDISRYDPNVWNNETAYMAAKAAWDSEGVFMAVAVYYLNNKSKITPVEWARNGGLKQFLAITIRGVSGVRYITKVTYGALFDEGTTSVTENSHVVGFILPHGDRIIDVSCSAAGVDYELYKSKCDEVINTFNFTE